MSFPETGELTDLFYHDSSELFSVIKKNLGLRLGIFTETVEKEAYETLQKAILSLLEEKVTDKVDQFKKLSVASNLCEEKMRKLKSYLLKEPTPDEVVMPVLHEVKQMYGGLKKKRISESEIKKKATEIVDKACKGMARRYKDQQYQIYWENLTRENYQLNRLHRTPASAADMRILAEAISVARNYHSSNKDLQILLASCDSNNFCPATSYYGKSMPVTDEIFNRFKIKCDWPREITKILRS